MRAIIAIVLAMLGASTTGRDELVVRVSRPEPPSVLPEPPRPWTFAVLSDLHLPNDHADTVNQAVAALVAMHVRFVVVTGDHTNGSDAFHGRPRTWQTWWPAVRTALQPLRDAGIAVLPIAGNHDSYWDWQRDGYAAAFADLAAWAAPLEVHGIGASTLDRPPFSYSVDVDGVHLVLAHVVAQHVDRDVAAWLEADLAAAQGAKRRIVFGHVPMVSVIREPKATFAQRLGGILEGGHVSHYVAGHEHVVWDEIVSLPAGGALEQISVGCSSGFYQYEPSPTSKSQAHCEGVAGKHHPMRCTMPDGGGEFMLAQGRKHRRVQQYKNSFTLFTVDGDDVRVRPMAMVYGRATPFYLDQR